MTTIRAVCPRCGEVTIAASEMEVVVCAQTREGTYAFSCPRCTLPVRREADRHVVQILVSGGVRMRMWDLPAELSEPKSGPPITWDDVLTFHNLLSTQDWFEKLEASI